MLHTIMTTQHITNLTYMWSCTLVLFSGHCLYAKKNQSKATDCVALRATIALASGWYLVAVSATGAMNIIQVPRKLARLPGILLNYNPCKGATHGHEN